jgi:hypothetical protein
LFLVAACGLALPAVALAREPGDGLREVKVERFGIVVHVPEAWELIDWDRNDRAFVVKLPEEEGHPVGYVACELGAAPENLEEFRRRHDAADVAEQKRPFPKRKLVENEIQKLDPERFGEKIAARLDQRLVSLWRYAAETAGMPDSFELKSRVISEGSLYTFILTASETHFDAYREDFEDMLASARFSEPHTGLVRLADGFWMQREFRFGMSLPPSWRPSFGPNDKVLFFATGATHQVFTDNLIVLATPRHELDFEALKKQLAEEVVRPDPNSEIVTSQVIPQGEGSALETVIRTRRGPFEITVVERRFQAARRNYEVKFTCDSAAFAELEEDLKNSLDSFKELPERPGQVVF